MLKNLNAPKKINARTSHDIKLELDVRCQKLIEKKLRADFPEVAVLGEEGNTGAPDAEYRWVIDPIDGTVAYMKGMPWFTVALAVSSSWHAVLLARRLHKWLVRIRQEIAA